MGDEGRGCLGRLYDLSVCLGIDGIMVGMEARNNNFYVKYFYSLLASKSVEPFSCGIVWNSWDLFRASSLLGGQLEPIFRLRISSKGGVGGCQLDAIYER